LSAKVAVQATSKLCGSPTVQGDLPAKPSNLARSLGARIVALRSKLELTQEKLAWETDLSSKGYLSRIESGKRLPSIDVLERLAHRLGVEVRDLFVFPERGDIDAAMDRIRTEGPALARTVLGSQGPVKARRTASRPKRNLP
jgi:transcriptional regulator with XRE-family HTH domain